MRIGVYLPPYSPLLNPIEAFFSVWKWKEYDQHPQTRIPLLQAMKDACGDIAADAFHGWIRHAGQYFPCCLAKENIACDVNEVLWSDHNRRKGEALFFIMFSVTLYSKSFYCFVCSVYVQFFVGWEWNVHCIHCFLWKNKILLPSIYIKIILSNVFQHIYV